jgi:Chs5-Arf1p-binding protein BUD7/BCH1
MLSMNVETGQICPYVCSHLFRQEATDALWLETYMSSAIRSILYADDESYRITGYRRLNPILNPYAERRFIDAVQKLFSNGIPCFSTINSKM